MGATSEGHKFNKNRYEHDTGLARFNYLKKKYDRKNPNVKKIENSLSKIDLSDAIPVKLNLYLDLTKSISYHD